MERRPGWLTLLACLGAYGCGAPLVEQRTEVERCSEVRLQGRLELADADADAEVAGVTLRGTDAALANSVVTLGDDSVGVSSSQHFVQVRLHCAGLNKLELIGEVHGELSAGSTRLDKIGVFGASRLQLRGGAVEVMTVRVAGQGHLLLSDVLAEQLDLQAAGDSRVVLSGESDGAAFNVSGSSEVDAAAFRAQQVQVELRGDSRTVVDVGAHLRGSVAAPARLSYSGTPDVVLDLTPGTSSVTALEPRAGARDQ